MKYLDLLYEGRYDELVRETFPILETDKDAERAFLRLFLQKQTTMLLNEHTTRHDLFNAAEKGNKYDVKINIGKNSLYKVVGGTASLIIP